MRARLVTPSNSLQAGHLLGIPTLGQAWTHSLPISLVTLTD